LLFGTASHSSLIHHCSHVWSAYMYVAKFCLPLHPVYSMYNTSRKRRIQNSHQHGAEPITPKIQTLFPRLNTNRAHIAQSHWCSITRTPQIWDQCSWRPSQDAKTGCFWDAFFARKDDNRCDESNLLCPLSGVRLRLLLRWRLLCIALNVLQEVFDLALINTAVSGTLSGRSCCSIAG
jgi:hypothetical protein